MRGFRITCTASGYREGSFSATKGWWVDVAESDPLVAQLKGNPAFKFTSTEVPDVFESAPLVEGMNEDGEPNADSDDIAKVPGIAAPLVEGMKAAGFTTVAKVLEAGTEGLTVVKGIGIPTATQIVLACNEYLGEE